MTVLPGFESNALTESIEAQVDRHASDWALLLDEWRRSDPGRELVRRVDARLAAGATVYPADVFRALSETPLSRARALILGQDPYHGAGQAEGLAFSVPPGVALPPSLRNIFDELQRDVDVERPRSGSLLRWARQGVLLLNTVLTVEQDRPACHAGFGWQVLTDRIVEMLARDERPKVFMLWGAHAHSKAPLLSRTDRTHLVLQCNHPSPLAARRGPKPFVGCAHFSRARDYLRVADPLSPLLDWQLDAP
jgi:uracil-DNA glycosylase